MDSVATFQIILNEGSNMIENHIMRKPECSWLGNKATLGIQNRDGTIGFPVQGYNATAWSAKDTAWKYLPDGPDRYLVDTIRYQLKPLTPGDKIVYKWYQAGTEIGEGQSINVTPNETTTYVVYARICAGDEFYDTVTVFVHPNIPNAFNPGSAIGKNKKFKILGVPPENITLFNMQIFDRWGQIVYETTDVTEGWDGTFKGKPCPSEVYNWVIFYETSKKTRISNKGQVTLIR